MDGSEEEDSAATDESDVNKKKKIDQKRHVGTKKVRILSEKVVFDKDEIS